MSKFDILKTAVTSKAGRQLLLARKHSPVLLFSAGVVGIVGTVVLACRATMKLEAELESHEKVQLAIDEEAGTEQISREQHAKDSMQLKLSTAGTIAKLYLPAVGLGIVSIAALTGSHVVLTQRNTALAGTLAALTKAHSNYRSRVATEYGAEVDQRFASDSHRQTINEVKADGSVATREVSVLDSELTNPYMFVFDERSKNFEKTQGHNRMFLMQAQHWANDKLRTRGHLFLNEVLDLVGLPRTKAGAVTGWLWERPDGKGDNYVSFGIFENHDEEWIERFIDGKEHTALLDFNVDGTIFDQI